MAYKARRDGLVQGLDRAFGQITLEGSDTGLHLLLRLRDPAPDHILRRMAARQGVRVALLSDDRLDGSTQGSQRDVGAGLWLLIGCGLCAGRAEVEKALYRSLGSIGQGVAPCLLRTGQGGGLDLCAVVGQELQRFLQTVVVLGSQVGQGVGALLAQSIRQGCRQLLQLLAGNASDTAARAQARG